MVNFPLYMDLNCYLFCWLFVHWPLNFLIFLYWTASFWPQWRYSRSAQMLVTHRILQSSLGKEEMYTCNIAILYSYYIFWSYWGKCNIICMSQVKYFPATMRRTVRYQYTRTFAGAGSSTLDKAVLVFIVEDFLFSVSSVSFTYDMASVVKLESCVSF